MEGTAAVGAAGAAGAAGVVAVAESSTGRVSVLVLANVSLLANVLVRMTMKLSILL